MPQVTVKRIYDETSKADGFRVLVDRIWPRGIAKKAAAIDSWAKEIAPSTELRKWFNHDPAKWSEFQKRYRDELKEQMPAVKELLAECGDRRLTLVVAAKDTHHNQAVVLKDVISGI